MIKESNSLSSERAYRPLPKLNELRKALLGNARRDFFNEFSPIVAVLVLEIVALVILAILHRRRLTPGPAFEQWYMFSALVPSFLSVVIVSIINIWKSRKIDSFEERWNREKNVSRTLSYCDPEEIMDLHVRLETELIINSQQSSTLVIDAAALSGLLAACAAILVALMGNRRASAPLMYAVIVLASSLIGLLLANLALARDVVIKRRLVGAIFKGAALAKQRINSAS